VDRVLDYGYCSYSSLADGRFGSLPSATFPGQAYLRSVGVIGEKDNYASHEVANYGMKSIMVPLHHGMFYDLSILGC